MFWLTTKRVFRSGLQNFFRNGLVSFSSVIIMTITLFILLSTILLGGFLNYSLNQVKQKVDVNVYFVTDATTTDIMAVQKSLEALPEVESVSYTSADQALANFKANHADDQLTLSALSELGTNPLGASLNIRAKDPSQYAGIADFLNSNNSELLSASGSSIIDSVNYAQNAVVINRLTNIINSTNAIGLWFAIIFILISIIITFNTIRLTIFMSKDEISVMKLVGASNVYVKGPFVVSGVFCGLIASAIILVLFGGFTFWVSKYHGAYFVGFDIFQYYVSHFVKIFFVICGSGIVFGAVASYLAVRKYLRD